MDKAMVPYFRGHECKQFMTNKSVKFRYNVLDAATQLGCAIQFYTYMGKTTTQL